MKITKEEIVRRVMEKHNLTLQKSQFYVETLLNIIKDNFQKKQNLLISGFGKFELKDKKPRKGRNPQTGETIILEERTVLTFSPSQKLRQEMNKSENKEKKIKNKIKSNK